MATLETLRRRVDATEDLHSVVRTMKALAAVNIRQFEQAAEAVQGYRWTVEMGLRAVFRHAHARRQVAEQSSSRGIAIIVGSDQGMCGQFNAAIVEHALETLHNAQESVRDWLILAIGEKAIGTLEAHGQSIDRRLSAPSSAAAVADYVRDVLVVLDQWQAEQGALARVLVVSNRYQQHHFQPDHRVLLPMDEQWLHRLRQQPWPTNQLPMHAGNTDAVLSHLVRQYLFVGLYGAMAESLAAENATRLRAMQSAEKNVEETLDDLRAQFNRQRQNSITAELLDVVSGSEAVAE